MVTRGFCHECTRDVNLLGDSELICERCRGSFVEILEADTPHPQAEEDQEDEDPEDQVPGQFPARLNQGQGPNGGMTLSNLLSGLLSGAVNQAGQGGTPAAGQTRIGNGMNVAWSFGGSGSGSGSTSSSIATGTGQGLRDASGRQNIPTLNSFLSSSFGNNPNQPSSSDNHVHDDGMGGAGGAGDGRNFNHDNHPSSNNPPNMGGNQAQLNDISAIISQLMGTTPTTRGSGNRGAAAGNGIEIGGGLMNLLMGGNGNLNLGDFAIGDSNLDDIISRLFEQTAGQNSTPRASDEEINKLERIKKDEISKIQGKKNVDCPICFDALVEDTNLLVDDFKKDGPTISDPIQSSKGPHTSHSDEKEISQETSSDDWVDEEDDPPEEVPKFNGNGKQKEEETVNKPSNLLVSLPCSHLFHEDCLIPWLKENGSCPICRTKLKSAEEAESKREEDQQAQQQQNHEGLHQQATAGGVGNSSSNQTPSSSTTTRSINGSFLLGPFPAGQFPNSFPNLLQSLLQPQGPPQEIPIPMGPSTSHSMFQGRPIRPLPNSTSSNPRTSTSAPVPTASNPSQDHYEQSDDTPERRRERMLRAAENRAVGAPSGQGNQEREGGSGIGTSAVDQTPPGGWGEEFDLD